MANDKNQQSFLAQSANEELPRRCSLTALSDKGNRVYGTAALLVMTKQAGGVDNFLNSLARKAVQETIKELQQQETSSQSKLKKVA